MASMHEQRRSASSRHFGVLVGLLMMLSSTWLPTMPPPVAISSLSETPSEAWAPNATTQPANHAREPFYLHSRSVALSMGNQTTIQVMNTTVGGGDDNNSGTQSVTVTAYLDPGMGMDSVLDGTIQFGVWIRGSGGPNSKATISHELQRTDANGSTYGSNIAQTSSSNVNFPTSYTEHTSQTTVSNLALPAGHRLKWTIDFSGNNGITYTARWGSATYLTRVELPLSPVIDPQATDLVDASGNATDVFAPGVTLTPLTLAGRVNSTLRMSHIQRVEHTVMAPNGSAIHVVNATLQGSATATTGWWNATWSPNGSLPVGTYSLATRYEDASGQQWDVDHPGDDTGGGHHVWANRTFEVQHPNTVTFACRDADGQDLPGLRLAFTHEGNPLSGTERVCDGAAVATATLPSGNITVQPTLQAVGLPAIPLVISGNASVNLTVAVSEVRLEARHDDGQLADEVTVYIQHPNGSLFVTGERLVNGSWNGLQLPAGTYTVTASWRGNPLPTRELVHNGTTGGSNLTLDTGVRTTRVRVTDNTGVPLAGVQLLARDPVTSALREAATTLPDGNASLVTVVGNYTVSIRWQRYTFAEQVIELNGTAVDLVIPLESFSVQVRDLDGSAVGGAALRLEDGGGELLALVDIDAGGNGSGQLPNGTYGARLIWQGTTVTLGTLVVNGTTNATLTAPVRSQEVRVTDTSGKPLRSLVLSATTQSGAVFVFPPTDDNGSAILRLPAENVTISLQLGETVLLTTSAAVNGSTWNLSVPLPAVSIRVVDPTAAPVSAVEVRLETPGGTLLGTNVTAADGWTALAIPNGSVIVRLRWLGFEVGNASLLVAGTTQATLTATIHRLSITAIDASNSSVDGVQVLVARSDSGLVVTSGTTDENGSLDLLLPSGRFTLSGWWRGTLVLDRTLDVNTTVSLQIPVEVLVVDVLVVDDGAAPLEAARVDVFSGDRLVDSVTTDLAGRASLRVAAEAYDVTLLWRDRVVANVTLDLLGPTPPTSVLWQANVSRLTIVTVDPLGVPVPGVTVSVRDGLLLIDSAATDLVGSSILRLPGGVFTLEASLNGIVLNETQNWTVSGGAVVTIIVALNTVSIRLLDQDGGPVEGALAIVRDPRGLGSDTASSELDGTLTFRLPDGTFDLDVLWRSRLILSTNLTMPVAQVDLMLPLAPFSVTVVDADGAAANDVIVTLRDPEGRLLLSDPLPGDGALSVLVGSGEHRLSVLWAGLELSTETLVPLNTSQHEVTLPLRGLSLALVDLDGEPLPGANVVLRLATGRVLDALTLDAAGRAQVYLPLQTVRVTASTQGLRVLTADVDLPVNGSLLLTAPVRRVNWQFVDEGGSPVADVTVELEGTGVRLQPVTSDVLGWVRLLTPNGTFDLRATWRGVEVLDTNLTEPSNGTVWALPIVAVQVALADPADTAGRLAYSLATVTDPRTGLVSELAEGETVRLVRGAHSVMVRWDGVLLPPVSVDVAGAGEVLVVTELTLRTLSLTDSNGGVSALPALDVTLAQASWSWTGRSTGNLSVIVPPGPLTLEVTLDGLVLRQGALRADAEQVALPLLTFAPHVIDSSGRPLEVTRVDVRWGDAAWRTWSAEGLIGPSGVDWEARVTYQVWTLERPVELAAASGQGIIELELARLSFEASDRLGEPLAEVACSVVADGVASTVTTDEEGAASLEVLVGTYGWSCRVPSAGEPGADGRRGALALNGTVVVTQDTDVDVVAVELPFAAEAQLAGLLGSDVGRAVSGAALAGWLVAIVLIPSFFRSRRQRRELADIDATAGVAARGANAPAGGTGAWDAPQQDAWGARVDPTPHQGQSFQSGQTGGHAPPGHLHRPGPPHVQGSQQNWQSDPNTYGRGPPPSGGGEW